jgi:hypothetical protein
LRLAKKRLATRREKDARLWNWIEFLELIGRDTKDCHKEHAWYLAYDNSPHDRMYKLLDSEEPRIAVFMPRGTGKSESVLLPWLCREACLDPTATVLLGSESLDLAIEKLALIRSWFERLERAGFGPYKTKTWTQDRIIIQRPSGIGGQATFQAWGPNVAGTGRHWRYGVWDDLYGERSADNPELVNKITRKFRRVFGQRNPNARMIIVGTLWPSKTSYYRKILEDKKLKKTYKVLRYNEYGRVGPDHLPMDDNTPETSVFPWLTKEFLDAQRYDMGEVLYRSQYKNVIVDDSEMGFETRHFHLGNPPQDAPKTTYIVTDSAYTTRRDSNSSMSALFLVQKVPNNIAYVMDGDMGRWDSKTFPRKLLDMYQRARENKMEPRWYSMENQGPGGQYPNHIHDVAKLLKIPPPVCLPISHGQRGKNHRIAKLRGPMESEKLFFSPDLNPNIFKIDRAGDPVGILGREFMRFQFDAKDSYDGLDALADVFGRDTNGVEACPPPGATYIPRTLKPYEEALRCVVEAEGRIEIG